MCGIIGFSGYVREGEWGETHAILEALLVAAEKRGEHATGFVAVTDALKANGKTEVVTAKQPLPASEFIKRNGKWRHLRHRRCSTVIGHTRFATHGSPEHNENNHPHTGDGLYAVTNGVLSNHEEVAARYGLRLKTECDSEVILRLSELFPHPAVGLALAMDVCRGSFATVLYDQRRDTTFIARVGKPLVAGRIGRRVFIASTTEILQEAFDKVFGERRPAWDLLMPFPSGHVFSLKADARLVLHELPEHQALRAF
jgi:glucosamine 6-phosphate synthetase-like amidotransferase/phosphosugar isomerase protein